MAELFDGRLMRESGFRTEISDVEWFFQCQCGRENLTENNFHSFFRKGTRIGLLHALDNIPLSMGNVEMIRVVFFGLFLAYLDGQFGATAEQLQ